MADSSFGIWKGSTNLIANGGVETNTTGWFAFAARDTSEHKFGVASLRTDLIPGIDQFLGYYDSVSVTAGNTYTFSIWVKGTAGYNITADIRWLTAGSILISQSTGTAIVSDGTWQRVMVTAVAPPTAAKALPQATKTTPGTGSPSFYVDGAQFEQSDYATPYIHTDGGTATRNAGGVSLANHLFNATQGWCVARVRMGGFASGSEQVIMYVRGATSSDRLAFYYDATHLYMDRGTNAGGVNAQADVQSYTADTIHTLIAQWNATELTTSSDGASFPTPNSSTNIPVLTQDLLVGNDNVNRRLDGDILWIMFGLGTLSDADAATIHAYGDTGPTDFTGVPGQPIILWKADTAQYLINWEYRVGPATIDYTDSGTARLVLTPSATDTEASIDAATASLTLTASAAEQRISTDAATAALVLTPSATEEHTTFDAATAALALSPSSINTAQFVDAATATLTTTASSTDTAQFVDSNVGVLVLTPSGVDLRTSTDAATNVLTLSPSGSDLAQFVDSATATLTITSSALEERQRYDAATAILALTPSATDDYVVGGTEYTDANTAVLTLSAATVSEQRESTDAGTVSLTLTASANETAGYVDATTATLILTPSSVAEGIEHADSATVSLTLSPSSTDVATWVDTGTVTLALSPSATEGRERFDQNTATLALTASSTDTAQYIETTTVVLTLTPSATEQLVQTGQDAATATLALQPSATDTGERIDVGTATLTFTVSAVDSRQAVDSNTSTLTLSPSGTDTYTGGSTFDADTSEIRLTPGASETTQYIEGVTASLTVTPSGVEQATYLEESLATLRFTPSSTDTPIYADSETALVSLTPSATDTFQAFDEATATLVFSPFSEFAGAVSDAATVLLTLVPSAIEYVAPSGVVVKLRYNSYLRYSVKTVNRWQAVIRLQYSIRLRTRWLATQLREWGYQYARD